MSSSKTRAAAKKRGNGDGGARRPRAADRAAGADRVSDENIGSWTLMREHIELFRQEGRGSFRDLMLAVTGDGAMLVRLDGEDSAKGKPNENYARELMELYALGPTAAPTPSATSARPPAA